MAHTGSATGAYDDLQFGDQLRYVGPDDLDGEYAVPKDRHAPFEFRHVTVGGTLVLETCHNARRRLAPEHPANERAHWEVVD